jgi:hypothetical protein
VIPKLSPKKKVKRSSTIIENKNNSRKYFSLHPKNTDCNKKGVMKENLEEEEERQGHHNRHKKRLQKSHKKRSEEAAR